MSILKKRFWITALCLIAVLSLVFTGCQRKNANGDTNDKEIISSSTSDDIIYNQKELQEPKELTVSEKGTLEIEVETLAKPDNTVPDEKSAFLSITLKEDADISVQYTYDTYGKEGMLFCCSLKESDTDETKLKPIASRYLAQLSKENYKETWLSNGISLEKGENLFYINGGEQTLPYRMTLVISFIDPDKIEKIVLYPSET